MSALPLDEQAESLRRIMQREVPGEVAPTLRAADTIARAEGAEIITATTLCRGRQQITREMKEANKA